MKHFKELSILFFLCGGAGMPTLLYPLRGRGLFALCDAVLLLAGAVCLFFSKRK